MNAVSREPARDDHPYDPVFLNARREAWIIFGVWVACLAWSVPYCYLYGYPPSDEEFNPETFSTYMGVPSWVCWGILVPWLLSNVFTIWFCFFYMKDDDLGVANEGSDLAEEISEMEAEQKGANA